VADARDIRVPMGRRVVLVLRSEDYLYTLAIPEYGLKEIAVPECEFRLEFRPRSTGRVDLFGEHLCGDPFAEITGKLVIEPPERFRAWLRR
jgi:cytochrome c oxidase subunit 2